MADAEVIVLGAGAAGLMAAAELSRRGVRTVVLEARERVGGRILTVRDDLYQVPLDLGAEFIHGRPEATWSVIRENHLTALDVPFDHFIRRHGRLVHAGDISGVLRRTMRGLGNLHGPDRSFEEYLARRPTDDRSRLARAFVEGFDAADPSLISARSLASEQEDLADVGQTQFRLRDGQQALIGALIHSLDRGWVRILLGRAVERVRWRDHRVLVGSVRGEEFESRRLIVTVPVGVLQANRHAAGAICFEPGLMKEHALSRLASGPVVKVLLRFRDPFWERAGWSKRASAGEELKDAVFFQDFEAPFPTWWTARPLRLPILTGWAGGPKADALRGLSGEEIIGRALASLAGLFDVRARSLREKLESAFTHDWLGDIYARGAYSYETVGGHRSRGLLAEPVADTIFFAGEATDTSGQASTVAGALASGRRAAAEVLRSLRMEPGDSTREREHGSTTLIARTRRALRTVR